MAKKKKKPDQKQTVPELVERIIVLSGLIWAGNKSQMARDLQVSQPVVSRVLAGQQKPTGQLLESLAVDPRVNVNWLFRGLGQPLVSRGDTPAVRLVLPVVQQVLPGLPQDHSDLLSETSFSVSENFFRPSRYWLSIQNDDPAVEDTEQKICADDLLLMEADKNAYPDPTQFNNRLCGVRLEFRPKKYEYRLGAVTYMNDPEEGEYWEVDFFDLRRDKSKLVKETVIREYPGGKIEAFKHVVREVPIEHGGRKRRKFIPPDDLQYEPIHGIGLDDIVAVSILVVRP